MSRIELRDCEILLQDGFGGTAALNGSPADEATSMEIDTVAALTNSTSIVPVGARFTVTGHSTTRTVTAVNSNEQQTVTLTAATGGTFTLTYAGQTTSALTFDEVAAHVQAALVALSTIGAGNVVVTGGTGGPWLIEFQGTLAATNVALMTASGASLTPAATVVVEETVKGVAATTNEQQTITVAAASSGHFHLSYGGQTTAAITFGATSVAVHDALELLSSVGSGQMTVTGPDGGPYLVEFTGTLSQTDVDMITTDATALVKTSVVAVVTTHVGAATWSLTFTPAVYTADLPQDDDVSTFLPQQVAVKVGDGSLSYTEHTEYEYLKDRGVLDTVRQKDDVPMDVKIDCVYESITTGTSEDISPMDALKGVGGAADWVSSATDQCEPYAVSLLVVHTPPCGSKQIETTLFPTFRSDSREINFKDATISVSGKSNCTEPTVTRS